MPNHTQPPTESVHVDEPIASPQDQVIDAVTVGQQDMLQSAESAGRAVFEGLGQVQREIAEFVSERIRQDIDVQKSLLSCRTFDDMRAVQSRFVKTAIDQYSTETTRLMRLGGDIAIKTIAPPRPK